MLLFWLLAQTIANLSFPILVLEVQTLDSDA
jgi:hypothetical protein